MRVGFPYLNRKGRLAIAFADEARFDPATTTLTAVIHNYPGKLGYQPKWVLIFGDTTESAPQGQPFSVSNTIKTGDSIHLEITFSMPWDKR